MVDLTPARRLARDETGLAVVSTTRADGTVQATVVNAGFLEHPVDGHEVAAFVTRGGSWKHRHLRERPVCALTFRRGWRWATVEGVAQLIGPDDPHPQVDDGDLRRLLRAVFTAAGGTHDDWDEYDRVMRDQRRLAVLVSPERAYTPDR